MTTEVLTEQENTSNNRRSSDCDMRQHGFNGNGGSGALLDMLAEVASQTLYSDPSVKSSVSRELPPQLASVTNTSRKKKVPCRNRIGENEMVDLETICTLSANHLIKLFSEFDGDEIRRMFTYTCFLEPEYCSKQFSSFGSESKARQLMKVHLVEHVKLLRGRVPCGGKFAAEPIKVRRRRLADRVDNVVYRKKRCGPRSTFTFEGSNENDSSIPNKETTNIVESEVPPPSVHLAKDFSSTQISNCSNCLESDKKNVDSDIDSNGLPKGSFVLEAHYGRICYEHSYTTLRTNESFVQTSSLECEENISEENIVRGSTSKQMDTFPIENEKVDRILSENVQNVSEESSAALGKFMIAETLCDTIMVCVMEDNQFQLKQLPGVGQEIDIEDTIAVPFRKRAKSENFPVTCDESNQTLSNSNECTVINYEKNIERDEYREKKKPKGKAKFIGQSKAEKEMAIQLIDKMKKKGSSMVSLECKICNPPRTFTAPTTLVSHYRSHAGIKPYECRICQSVFTRQHSLNYHMLIHSNQTRFTCMDCGRKFRHPSHFKEHRRRHTGESPYECSDCMLRFKTRNTYKRHLKTRHGKVLTTSGGLIILSEEEFKRVRTLPRSRQTNGSSVGDRQQGKKNVLKGNGKSSTENQAIDIIEVGVNGDKNADHECKLNVSGINEQEIKALETSSSGTPSRLKTHTKKSTTNFGCHDGMKELHFVDTETVNIVEKAMRQSDLSFSSSRCDNCNGTDCDIPCPHTCNLTISSVPTEKCPDLPKNIDHECKKPQGNTGESLMTEMINKSNNKHYSQSSEKPLIVPQSMELPPLVINTQFHQTSTINPVLSNSTSFPQTLKLTAGLEAEIIGLVGKDGISIITPGPHKAIMLLTSGSSCGLPAHNPNSREPNSIPQY